jgi:hypothetical protein
MIVLSKCIGAHGRLTQNELSIAYNGRVVNVFYSNGKLVSNPDIIGSLNPETIEGLIKLFTVMGQLALCDHHQKRNENCWTNRCVLCKYQLEAVTRYEMHIIAVRNLAFGI